MKTLICLVVMLAISSYASALCTAVAASFCQSCTSAACDSCYNYGNGTNKDKIWATSSATTCTGTLPATWKVTNCLINASYGASTLNASTVVAATSHPRCTICDGKKFLYYASTATTETCSDTAPTAMTSCLEIANCMTTVCKTDATTAYSCAQCNDDKYPTGVSTTTSYNTACGSVTTAITNCYRYTHSVSSGVVSYYCNACKSGYAIAYAGTSCIVNADPGCFKFTSGDVFCGECWYAYYFSGAVCIAKSYVGVMIGLIAFIGLFLVQ